MSRRDFIAFCEEEAVGGDDAGGLTPQQLELKRRLQKAVKTGRVRDFVTIFETADRRSDVRAACDVPHAPDKAHTQHNARCAGPHIRVTTSASTANLASGLHGTGGA